MALGMKPVTAVMMEVADVLYLMCCISRQFLFAKLLHVNTDSDHEEAPVILSTLRYRNLMEK